MKINKSNKIVLNSTDELNTLELNVIKMINTMSDNYSDIKDYLREIAQYGCSSGIVSELIYYTDTLKFYRKYKMIIQAMVTELVNEFGMPLNKILNGFDDTDIFCNDTQNQNLLSWYAMETICNNLLSELENN